MPTELKGAANALNALQGFENDIRDEYNRRIVAALSPIVQKARGFLPSKAPLSNWQDKGQSDATQKYRRFPLYDASKARSGIGFTKEPTKPNRKGWSSLAVVYNSDPAGAIYETAGRKNPQGQKVFKPTKFTPSTYRESGKNFNKSNNPNAGKQFIGSMPRLYNAYTQTGAGRRTRKGTGRVIFRAWAEDNGAANTAVLKAIEDAKNKFYDRMRKST